jgi:uncharacterized membrane protein
MIQYFYRAAPYVDASMQATAALIISAVKEDEIQESAEKMAKEIVAAEKEEAEAEAEAEAQAEAEAEEDSLEGEEAETETPSGEEGNDEIAEPSDEEEGQRQKF